MKKLLFLVVLLFVPFAYTQAQGSDNDTVWTKDLFNTGNITQVSFTPDSQNVAVASGGSILVFKINNGELVKKISENTELIYSFKISDDGSILVTSTTTPLITVWDFLTGDTIRTIKVPASVTSISLFNNNFIIGIVQNKTITNNIYIWDANTGKIINQIGNGWYWSLALSKQKNIFAIGTQGDVSHKSNVELWDLSTLKYITTLGSNSESFDGVAFSPEGKYLGTACDDGFIKIWDVDSRILKYSLVNDSIGGSARTICFSPDSKFIISGDASSIRSNTKIWNIETGELVKIFMPPYGCISGLDISKDGKLLAGGKAGDFFILKNSWYHTSTPFSNQIEKLLFPNPASDFISISLINCRVNHTVDKVEIYSIEGMLMQSTSPQPSPFSERAIQVDVSGIVPGVYFVKIGDRVQRFVKL